MNKTEADRFLMYHWQMLLPMWLLAQQVAGVAQQGRKREDHLPPLLISTNLAPPSRAGSFEGAGADATLETLRRDDR